MYLWERWCAIRCSHKIYVPNIWRDGKIQIYVEDICMWIKYPDTKFHKDYKKSFEIFGCYRSTLEINKYKNEAISKSLPVKFYSKNT